jgi:hypothetical protein
LPYGNGGTNLAGSAPRFGPSEGLLRGLQPGKRALETNKGLTMKKGLFLLYLLLCMPSVCFADEIIQGHYCYTYGDSESLMEAKALTRTLAIRDAIESYKVFVESSSTVANFALTSDLVQLISSGYLRNIQVLKHDIKGRTICETVQASVSPQEIATVVKKLAKERAEQVEALGVDNNGCLKILKVKRKEEEVSIVVKVLKHTGSLTGTHDQNLKPCFKVCVDFFDAEGDPMKGDSQFIHTSASEMLPGEITAVAFEIPWGAKSFKAWLPKE